jgi:hypothetical protein
MQTRTKLVALVGIVVVLLLLRKTSTTTDRTEPVEIEPAEATDA